MRRQRKPTNIEELRQVIFKHRGAVDATLTGDIYTLKQGSVSRFIVVKEVYAP
jgi:hypothetical protein